MHTPSSLYVEWNARLLDYCLKEAVDEHGRFTLAVRQMLDDSPGIIAEAEFTNAVKQAYSHLLNTTSDPVFLLAQSSDTENRPLGVAFLGVAVMASEGMHANEYYTHLASLLDQPQEGSSVRGFVHRSFERCWMALSRWLEKQNLWMEQPDEHARKYIRWPKLHALLRLGDVEKLPRFFREYKLSPLRHCSTAHLADLFSLWIAEGHSGITATGRRAWADDVKQASILRQIVHVLDRWDEKQPQASFKRASAMATTHARLVLEIPGGAPRLSLRARQPDGFPNQLASGIPETTWRSVGAWGVEAWFEDLAISGSELEYLAEGFETPRGRHKVRFRGRRIFVFTMSEAGYGFEMSEEGGLPLNAPCAVLCHKRLERNVREYLYCIAGLSPRSCNLSDSWTVFHSFVPILEVLATDELASLQVTKTLSHRFWGGLNSGHSLSWLEGAPPQRLEVLGRTVPAAVFINGIAHPLVHGELGLDTLLQRCGEYQFRIGTKPHPVIIEPVHIRLWNEPEPALNLGLTSLSAPKAESTLDSLGFNGLSGTWTYIGSASGEVYDTWVPGLSARVQWAIGHNLAGLPAAVALSPDPRMLLISRAAVHPRALQRWADAILAVKKPCFGSVWIGSERKDIQRVWESYAAAALLVRQSRIRYVRSRQENCW